MKVRFIPLLSLLLLLLPALPGGPGISQAEPSFASSNCMIEYSPFYQKLLKAGVFDLTTAPDAEKTEPMKLLFIKAHLFHYASETKSQTEKWQSAEETTRLFSGDCADKAIWLYTHMRKNGYQNVSLVIGRYSPSSRVLHMWLTYEETPGETLLLDPTMQRKPWKVSDFSKRYYKPVYMLSGDKCVAF